MVELTPAATLDGAALAALFTAGYEGYWFPIAVDAPAFALMTGTTDVDLRLSRVAIEDGEPVAIALVARRGTEGWIGGMGVVASHRRRGIGEATLVAALDAARAAGIERVTLEVLEQNLPARASTSGSASSTCATSRSVEPPRPERAATGCGRPRRRARVDAPPRRTAAEPWQRADASHRRGSASGGSTVERLRRARPVSTTAGSASSSSRPSPDACASAHRWRVGASASRWRPW